MCAAEYICDCVNYSFEQLGEPYNKTEISLSMNTNPVLLGKLTANHSHTPQYHLDVVKKQSALNPKKMEGFWGGLSFSSFVVLLWVFCV